MEPIMLNMFLLLIGLTLSPGGHSVKITTAMNGFGFGNHYGDHIMSFYDWQLEPNQIVPIYTTAQGDKPRFAFIAHDPSKMTAEVTMATLLTINDDQHKSCEVDFSNPYDGRPTFQRLDIINETLLEVRYTTAALRLEGGGGWMDEVDTSKCPTPERARASQQMSKAEWNSIHHFENTSYSAEDILHPATVNSTNGFIFTRKNNETNPSTSIIFVNSATKETTVLDVIQATDKPSRDSYAHGKHGFCLMEGTVILCIQKSWNKQVIMNYTHIVYPKKVVWFDVHNLKSKAMLVVTTDCPGGKCQEIKIRKVEEGDKVNKKVDYIGFGMDCQDPASNLKMYFTDVANYDNICFNFVCTGKDYVGRRVFQYRRLCIERNYFESN